MKIIDIYNNEYEIGCLGCSIVRSDFTPPGGLIYETDHFCVNQDCEIPIPGFLILSSKRHIQSVDEFNDEEKRDFIDILVKIRQALRKAVGFDRIDIIQVEHGEHHLHFWFFPMTEEIEKMFGFGVRAVKPAMEYAMKNWKTEERIKVVEDYIFKLKRHLAI
jgi:diadenosine tetraphosphate (Ap4A) HIT family hydrolase